MMFVEFMLPDPVFFENLSDNQHCAQAAAMMALHSLGQEVTFDEMDRLIGFKKDRYCWTITVANVLGDRLSGVELFSTLDYRAFAEKGEDYLKTYWSKEWYEDQRRGASPNFKEEQASAAAFLASHHFDNRLLSRAEIEQRLQNCFVIALVDTSRFFEDNYLGAHSVFLFDQDPEYFILHDPGLPGRPSVKVLKEAFINARPDDFIVVPRLSN